jgi:hypothetical protein
MIQREFDASRHNSLSSTINLVLLNIVGILAPSRSDAQWKSGGNRMDG